MLTFVLTKFIIESNLMRNTADIIAWILPRTLFRLIDFCFFILNPAKLPTDKQHATVKSQRGEELKARQSLYEWGDDKTYSDLPGFVKAADVKALPKDVQFTEEAQYDLHRARRRALINLGLVHLLNLWDNWDDFDDYRKVLYCI